MIEDMERVRMTEAEVASDFAAVLGRLQHGAEVVVERDHRPVAVISPVKGPSRPIDECIALAKAHAEKLGYAPVPDPDFAADVQAAVDAHREPLDTSAWD
jgi:antitoxin (DNA-binding transcriptional repressor) of toxin-antitoxin stability system